MNSTTAFLNDLMIVLDNVAKRGIDPIKKDECPIHGFDYWIGECAKLLISGG